MKTSLKFTAIWTLNYLVFSRLNVIIRNNSGPDAIDSHGALAVLSSLFFLSRLIETEQGKDVYIVFLFFLFVILNFIK